MTLFLTNFIPPLYFLKRTRALKFLSCVGQLRHFQQPLENTLFWQGLPLEMSPTPAQCIGIRDVKTPFLSFNVFTKILTRYILSMNGLFYFFKLILVLFFFGVLDKAIAQEYLSKVKQSVSLNNCFLIQNLSTQILVFLLGHETRQGRSR